MQGALAAWASISLWPVREVAFDFLWVLHDHGSGGVSGRCRKELLTPCPSRILQEEEAPGFVSGLPPSQAGVSPQAWGVWR